MTEKEFELYRQGVDRREEVYVQADIARQLTIANEYRESELTVGRAIVEALKHTVAIVEPKPDRELARHQPCGCVVCFCFGDRCRDCGAKNCGKDDCVLKTSKGIVYADGEPAPDALVEAVTLIARDQAGKYMIEMGKGDRDEQWMKGKIDYKILMKEALEVALDAYKKAVR